MNGIASIQVEHLGPNSEYGTFSYEIAIPGGCDSFPAHASWIAERGFVAIACIGDRPPKKVFFPPNSIRSIVFDRHVPSDGTSLDPVHEI